MDETVAEKITLTRKKGSNVWEIQHNRFLEETRVDFQVAETASGMGVVLGTSEREISRPLAGRTIHQLELIVQAAS